jgi:hypothetical protein
MSPARSRVLLSAAHTAIFIGYLTVWLPGPAAGLTLIGVEIGEWIKFLGVGPIRDLFYLPPITLGLMLILTSIGWSNRRWQTWAMRALAVSVSLLAFPAIEIIRFGPASEWLLRLQLIALVLVVAVLSGTLAKKRPAFSLMRLSSVLLAIVGVVGAVLPTWVYLKVRPLVSQVIGLPIGIGLGVWLNGLGHLLAAAVIMFRVRNAGGSYKRD